MTRSGDIRFFRDIEHLHSLGPRAVAEFLAEIANENGCATAISGGLAEYRRITAAMIAAAGAGRMLRRLSVLDGRSHSDEAPLNRGAA